LAPFLSFEKLLRKYLRLIKPRRILEWGTGYSTTIMAEECPNAKIDTFEHDEKWFYLHYNKYHRQLPNVTFHLRPLEEGYVTCPSSQYDLIFIDGRERVRCMQTARKIVSATGVVILHDSERERYASGKALFRIIEEKDGTAVMRI